MPGRDHSLAARVTRRADRLTRPTACRHRSHDDCELDAPAEDGFEVFFPDYDALLAYCQRRFTRWP